MLENVFKFKKNEVEKVKMVFRWKLKEKKILILQLLNVKIWKCKWSMKCSWNYLNKYEPFRTEFNKTKWRFQSKIFSYIKFNFNFNLHLHLARKIN